MKLNSKIAAFVAISFFSLAFSLPSYADTSISLMDSKHNYANMPMQKITQLIKNHIDVKRYKNVKVQIIYNNQHQPDHMLVYLFSKKFHEVEVTKINLDSTQKYGSIVQNYQMKAEDFEQQPGESVTGAHCPDPSIEFISFAPNFDPKEILYATEVDQAAKAHHLKSILLLRNDATRSNYINYMSCPNLKGNFYDGDANPELIIATDGAIRSSDIDRLLRNQFRYRVTNIWLACKAYNDPMKTSVLDTAQSQKYAAGINNLLIGPSDEAAVCTMKAAMDGKLISVSFKECYDTYDKPKDGYVDIWGIDGNGSDYFGI